RQPLRMVPIDRAHLVLVGTARTPPPRPEAAVQERAQHVPAALGAPTFRFGCCCRGQGVAPVLFHDSCRCRGARGAAVCGMILAVRTAAAAAAERDAAHSAAPLRDRAAL